MCEEYIQKLLLKWTLKWVVSKEQKSITEEIITLSCTHLTFRFLYLVVSQHRKLMQVHMSFKSLVTHRSDISVFIPPVCSPHWAEIICLHICPGLESSCLWPPEKEMITHSSILAWEVPWTEGTGNYSPWGRKELDMMEQLKQQQDRHQIQQMVALSLGWKERN